MPVDVFRLLARLFLAPWTGVPSHFFRCPGRRGLMGLASKSHESLPHVTVHLVTIFLCLDLIVRAQCRAAGCN